MKDQINFDYILYIFTKIAVLIFEPVDRNITFEFKLSYLKKYIRITL